MKFQILPHYPGKRALWDGEAISFAWWLRINFLCSRIISTFSLEVPDLVRPEYFLFKFKSSFLLEIKDISLHGWRWRYESTWIPDAKFSLFDALAVNVSSNKEATFIMSELHFKKWNICTSKSEGLMANTGIIYIYIYILKALWLNAFKETYFRTRFFDSTVYTPFNTLRTSLAWPLFFSN